MKSKTEFIHANGKGLVDSGDEPIPLNGWGFGTCLLPYGYICLAAQTLSPLPTCHHPPI